MSVYISQLPLYTGNTYNGYIIWNDSGETTTYKTLFQQQLITGTGAGETYRTPTATASGTDSIAIGDGASHSGGSDGIAIGKNASATSNRSTAIGGSVVTGGAATALGWGCTAAGLASAALGYFNNTPNQYALAVGSSNSVYADFSTAIGGNNYMVGGTFNITLGWDIALSSGSYNTMIGGKTNTFTSTGSYNNILGGKDNIISGTTEYATMIGCSGRTANADNTTYTEHSYHYGQVYGGTSSQTGSTITINMNNGNIHFIQVTANLGLTLTNLKNGGTYRVVVETTGNYTLTSLTTSGFTQKVDSNFNNLVNNGFVELTFTCVNGYVTCRHSGTLS